MKTQNRSLNAFCLLAVAVFAIGIQSGYATLLLDENFNYTAGTTLAGNGGWVAVGATADDIMVASGNLTVPGLESPTGNKISFGGSGDDAYNSFTNQTSGSVYYSFVMNVTNITSLTTPTASPFVSLGSTTDITTGQGAAIWAQKDADNSATYNLGLAKRTAAQWTTTELSLNTSYLVVVSYQFVSGVNNDVCKLWINPSSSSFGATEPAASLTYSAVESDRAAFASFGITQSAAANTPIMEMDSLRIGNSWAEVTPIPEPATWALLALGLACVTVFRRRRAA